jgi:hypothetical protein
MGGCFKRATLYSSASYSYSPTETDYHTANDSIQAPEPEHKVRFDKQYHFVYSELTCQICHERLQKPMTMPCLTHSLCLPCAEEMWRTWLKQGDFLICPTCGESGGKLQINSDEFLKPNNELDNIMMAYEKERNMWCEERKQLEDIIDQVKGGKPDEENINLDEVCDMIEKMKEDNCKRVLKSLIYSVKTGMSHINHIVNYINELKKIRT